MTFMCIMMCYATLEDETVEVTILCIYCWSLAQPKTQAP